jgi:hypothetical protein
MKMKLIVDDKVCFIDDVPMSNVDMSTAPSNVWALHWNGSAGHIEYRPIDGVYQANEAITQLPSWTDGVKASWQSQKDLYDQKVAQFELVKAGTK